MWVVLVLIWLFLGNSNADTIKEKAVALSEDKVLEKARRDREALLEKPRLDKEVLEKASLEQEMVIEDDQDIIQEILLRLPVESLVRCTCLSKKWNAFISYNKYFRNTYISRHGGQALMMGFFLDKVYRGKETTACFLPTSSDGRTSKVPNKRKRCDNLTYDDDVDNPVDCSLSFLGHDIVHVLASSNGFLLVTLLERNSPVTYMICNPINKQQIVLPKPNLELSPQCVVHGFTCDAALTHYKIVRALCFETLHYTTPLTLEIFSSDLPQYWRRYDLTCPCPYFLDLSLGLAGVIKECVTYLPACREIPRIECPEQILLVFDESKEILQVMDVPPSEDDMTSSFFGMSEGLIVFGLFDLHQLKMWSLNDKGDGEREWSPKHKVNLKTRVENYFECAKDSFEGVMNLIAFHPADSQVFFLGSGNKNYQYHVNSSRFELICDLVRGYEFFPYTYPLIGPHLFRDH
ncbi:hypothetical protein FRX31_029714 [Thalictrum thalictroides]|uniref:F-box domain-containing protein n=1 Tax=Thalictrum thalictroides TaxID=46969 RepID=A0A7J6V6H6_THATH|nr:hypothetical protein FRX31_029714 [Thalictrum thalictroides]